MTAAVFDIAEVRMIEAWLAEEFELQEALIVRLREMQTLIVKSDLAGLEHHLVASAELLERLECIERRRKKIFQAVLSKRGLLPMKGSLKKVPDFAPANERENLRSRVLLLEGAARQVRLLNNRNGMLARSSLELTEEFVRRMFLAPAGTRTYDPKGRKQTRPEMILDRSL